MQFIQCLISADKSPSEHKTKSTSIFYYFLYKQPDGENTKIDENFSRENYTLILNNIMF